MLDNDRIINNRIGLREQGFGDWFFPIEHDYKELGENKVKLNKALKKGKKSGRVSAGLILATAGLEGARQINRYNKKEK